MSVQPGEPTTLFRPAQRYEKEPKEGVAAIEPLRRLMCKCDEVGRSINRSTQVPPTEVKWAITEWSNAMQGSTMWCYVTKTILMFSNRLMRSDPRFFSQIWVGRKQWRRSLSSSIKKIDQRFIYNKTILIRFLHQVIISPLMRKMGTLASTKVNVFLNNRTYSVILFSHSARYIFYTPTTSPRDLSP